MMEVMGHVCARRETWKLFERGVSALDLYQVGQFYFLPLRRMAMQGMVKVEDESMGLWTDVEWSTDIFLEPKEV